MADTGLHAEFSDRSLVESFLNDRCERAFRALYQRHTPVLYRVALRMSAGRRRDAEDIVQTTWIRAAERLSGFRWESALPSWLTGIALNCCREAIRRRARDDGDTLDGLDGPVSPARNGSLGRIDLERAISRLPAGYREVLILHDIEGYTHAEIGSLLGIETGTSKSQLSRARRAVRTWLNDTRETDARETHEPRLL